MMSQDEPYYIKTSFRYSKGTGYYMTMASSEYEATKTANKHLKDFWTVVTKNREVVINLKKHGTLQ